MIASTGPGPAANLWRRWRTSILSLERECGLAAPLILLAQTGQSDRDKADADAKHREALAQASIAPAVGLEQVG